MATKKQQHRPSQQANDSFEVVARRLGCSEDKAEFEAKLKKIAQAKPPKKRPKR